MNAKVLVVDDDPDILSGLQARLRLLGHDAITAKDGIEALESIERDTPDLVLLDLEMPGLSGFGVLQRMGDNARRDNGGESAPSHGSATTSPPVIVMTAYGTIQGAVEAMKLGAYDFLTKPFDADHLSLLIQKVLERAALIRQVEHLRSEVDSQYGSIVGESPKTRSVVELARRAASSRATLLLLGETGTGKDLLARAVHRWSERGSGPFMVVNCAAFPEALLENELFGHEKGAFTGADVVQQGKIEAADGGTVFLDEIGDMPVALQARLLRLLQDQEFHRVGGTRTIRVKVRFIAATNKDLQRAVRTGMFREDLFFRLNILTITLPPLRDRLEDLPQLAMYLLGRQTKRAGKGQVSMSPQAINAMMQYPWPGNVRELESVLARAVVLSDQKEIRPEQLGLTSAIPSTAAEHTSGAPALPYRESLEVHSRWLILEALRRAGWNQTKAAEQLQLQRTYLVRLLKRKGISSTPPVL